MAGITRVKTLMVLVVLIGAFSGAIAGPAEAAVLHVNTTSDVGGDVCNATLCSLRQAIAVANEDPDADTIILPAGYYKLSNAFSSLSIEDPVTINGAGAAITHVLGDEYGRSGYGQRMLRITSDAQNVTLSGFTIRGGDASADGSGIFTSAPVLTLNQMRLEDNTASGFSGGGLVNDTGTTVNINSSTLSDNFATNGGALFNVDTINVTASTVVGNVATTAGGALHNSGTTTFTSSTVSGNQADGDGGAIENAAGIVNLNSSTMSHNEAGGEGGAVHNSAVFNADRSTLSDNIGLTGGALDNGTGDNATIVSSTLSGNEAVDGGAIDAFGTVTVRGSTLTDNTATADGGAIDEGEDTTLIASIVVGNAAPNGPDCTLGVATGGFNVVGATGGCPSNGTGDTTAVDDSFLGPLANNGGPTQTHAIASGSPPVGNAGADPACTGSTTDQRGVVRPDNACDSGAYELTFCRGVIVNVVGTNGSDNLAGTSGSDGILAQGGNDRASGGDGNDAICGGTGKDKLVGGSGNDTLDGGPGTDTCKGNGGNDKFKACETAVQ